jgi:hypothetical protein
MHEMRESSFGEGMGAGSCRSAVGSAVGRHAI